MAQPENAKPFGCAMVRNCRGMRWECIPCRGSLPTHSTGRSLRLNQHTAAASECPCGFPGSAPRFMTTPASGGAGCREHWPALRSQQSQMRQGIKSPGALATTALAGTAPQRWETRGLGSTGGCQSCTGAWAAPTAPGAVGRIVLDALTAAARRLGPGRHAKHLI